MRLTYIYHSGFAIENEDFVIIIDFFKDTEARKKGVVHDHLLKTDKKIYVLSSHIHPDHFNREILSWKEVHPDIRYIFSKDILEGGTVSEADAFFLSKGETYQDEKIKVKAYGSTDVGISFLIEAGGKVIFHAGDLNNWHWNEEVPEEEAKAYEAAFLTEVAALTKDRKELDVLMFPVDPRLGKDYMLGAEQILDRIRVRLFAPMHFGQQYKEASAFGKYAESKNTIFVAWEYKGQSINF